MVKAISDKAQIARLHGQFQNKLKAVFNEKIFCRVGYTGGSFEDNVYYSVELDLWVGFKNDPVKTWNGFGIGRPSLTGSNAIVVEINFLMMI